ncbi:MAG: hypothetical protein HOM14_19925 [Gammaproteobacteria bacterium]|jgi:hypothetical protein|nr:hypothetical protein [Gammaproteobacteria bacterium]MBT3725703.1 hypothetical protein [Gammaproteobacteria bacterium]MBT4195459.1 hypothetical protein [Gammaproteobacteria bacterium]MBT4449434.1 hypothetical protein [Gammaproteobacteria bacterium]MBT4860379.1 hypothetical protein [Gammaproteobacteria bacterium]
MKSNMKLQMRILFTLLMIFYHPLNVAERISDIANTRHNFSTSGTGTVKASEESQICVFCHTPHHSESIPNAPLWNRKASGATYTPYTSNSIDANDIAATPGGSSKLCLSCHDGTIAIGSVNVLNAQSNVNINLTGTGAGGVMPSGAGDTTGFTRKLGTDLGNDHPISFTYNSVLANTDGELRNPDIEAHIGNRVAGNTPLVPLQDNQLQCTSCHDPHIRDSDIGNNIKFLRLNRFQQGIPAGGNFSAANDIVCLACHDKLGQAWSGSAHADPLTANETYTTAAANQREFALNLPVWKASCLNCHDTHTVQGSRRLLREGTDSLSTPKTGGNAALEEACYTCHSATGGVLNGQGGGLFEVPDIKTDFTTGLTHMPITTVDQSGIDETHDVVDADLVENKTKFNLSNRHVECTDCHNPHRVTKNRLFNNTSSTAAGTHSHVSGHTNIASGVLRGSWGVEPVYGSNRFDPTNFPVSYIVKRGDGGDGASTQLSSTHITREYQICLKCHSDYAYGSNPPNLGDTGGNTSAGTNDVSEYTNQAIEFQAPLSHKGEVTTLDSGASSSYSTNNHRSWHPVIDNTGRTLAIRNANSENWLSPFNGAANVGNQTMYCSDCHGSNTGSGTSAPSGGENGNAWGPHGSSNNFILKGGWSQNTGTGNSNDLCFKCHDFNLYATRGGGRSGFGGSKDENLHSFHADKIGHLNCSWCHVSVPHGWKNKAFLVNLNDVGLEAGSAPGTQVRNNTTAGYTNGPYYNNAFLKIRSFATSGNWEETNCGSAGTPGNGEIGRDWMRDSSENCANPP